MNNESMREKLSNQALRDVQQYSWQDRMKKIIQSMEIKLMKLNERLWFRLLLVAGLRDSTGINTCGFQPRGFSFRRMEICDFLFHFSGIILFGFLVLETTKNDRRDCGLRISCASGG